MTVEKEMKVNRCIRAYHKNLDRLVFAVQLPPDALTFLSTLCLHQDKADPLLYCVYDLTKEQVELIFGHYHLLYAVDTDYFDYQLDCDSVAEDKVKTQDELFAFVEQYCIDFVTSITGGSDSSFGVPASYKQDFWALKELLYKIYQQGVTDGRL